MMFPSGYVKFFLTVHNDYVFSEKNNTLFFKLMCRKEEIIYICVIRCGHHMWLLNTGNVANLN